MLILKFGLLKSSLSGPLPEVGVLRTVSQRFQWLHRLCLEIFAFDLLPPHGLSVQPLQHWSCSVVQFSEFFSMCSLLPPLLVPCVDSAVHGFCLVADSSVFASALESASLLSFPSCLTYLSPTL